MTEIIKETVTSQDASPMVNETNQVTATQVKVAATTSQTIEYFVYFFFGVLEILLAFRLIFKLAGAGTASAFIGFIYGVTGLFILPFEGIFRRALTQGLETTSVLEPATLVALAVYAVVAWGIVRLVRIFSGEQQKTN
jgi:hypothetical protein